MSLKMEPLTSFLLQAQVHFTGTIINYHETRASRLNAKISLSFYINRIDGVKPTDERIGFQRTRLLKPPPPDGIKQLNKEEMLRSLLIANEGVKVPGDETTYWCNVVRLPANLRRLKHHVVQFESAIQSGRESLVHHMEVFHCESPSPDEVIPLYSGPCDSPDRPEATRVCKRVIAAWAFGAGPFVYPPVIYKI